jgi:hypothetical protein
MARSVLPRSSSVSCVIHPRLGASDAAPSAPMLLSARTAAPRLAPRLAPRKPQPPATAPRPTASALSTQHHHDIAGVRKHPLTAQAQPMARSVLPRSSDVSCVILPRLGASDAVPKSPIRLSARTAAPRLAPRRPHHPLQPSAHPPRPKARIIISALQAFASTRSQHELPPMHAAYFGGPAQSAASSFRDSVPTMLPQLLRSNCLHAPAAPRLAPRRPHRPLQPHAQPPQPTARNIIFAQPAFASTRSQRKLPPMHAAYFGGAASSAAASFRDSVPATLPQLLRSD